jgi:hypothetical protein
MKEGEKPNAFTQAAISKILGSMALVAHATHTLQVTGGGARPARALRFYKRTKRASSVPDNE